MQFACENCKTQLQIADDKVRGKRLIVRCKRCGAKIAIADPALRGAAGPRLVSAGFPAARPAPQQRPAQSHPAQTRPAPGQNGRPRDTDIESTRAMESEVLEKALRASKQDAAAQNGDPQQEPQAAPAAEPDAQQAPVAAPEDEALWFAMLHGNQTGPLTRAELTGRANSGEVGPRTYLWREGMDAWQRAKDVSELAFLFPKPALTRPSSAPVPASSAPPPSPPPKPEAPEAQPAANDAPQPAAFAAPDDRLHHDDVARDLFTPGETPAVHKTPADLARWASEELAKKRSAAEPKEASSSRMFEGAAPAQSRGPFGVFVVLLALAVAAAILWTALGPKDKTVEARPDAGEGEAAPPADAGKAAAAAAEPPAKPAQAPAPARATPPPGPAPVPGLTSEQVFKKIDEHKPALQACVDEAIRRDPHLSLARLKIATTIAPSGRVTSAHINSPAVEQAPLGACLRKATRKIVFPSFTGEPFDVEIPLSVSAGN